MLPGPSERNRLSAMDEEIQRLFDEANRARVNGDYEAAQPLLEQAVRACPDAAPCWWALAHVLLNTGDFDRSISRFEKAIELDPENQRYLVDLARSLEMLGEYERAKPLLERVLEISPTTREAEDARKSLSYY
jgi:tetratricopeptide (TPR) repeat protein